MASATVSAWRSAAAGAALRAARRLARRGPAPPGLADVAWQLEELRVATFAQPLAVKRPGQPAVSAKRIAATLDANAGEVTDTVELLQTLIRNRCVNDGSPESGEEVRNADVLQNYIEGPGVTVERFEPTPGRCRSSAASKGPIPMHRRCA